MKLSKLIMLAGIGVIASLQARADDSLIIAKLKDSKISLLDGIRQAERTSGPVTSAKFEMDGANLSLSIYTAPQGLETPAENNDLTELSGNPTVAPFAPATEVFKDKEHIARASVHLTLMQISKLTLPAIIRQAIAVQSGVPYSAANPTVRNGEPVADILIADKNGQSVKVTLNILTGRVVR